MLLLALGFFSLIILLSWIDLKFGILPDYLTFSLLWLGLLANPFMKWVKLYDAVIGVVLAYLVLFSLFYVVKYLYKKEALGFGDLKLLAALAAWFGWQAIPWLLFIASLSTLSVLCGLWVFKKYPQSRQIPFGPGLGFAGGVLFILNYLTIF